MMSNNQQRLNIWLALNDRFNYIEFKQACETAGCAPLPLAEFAQKSGMVAVAMVRYTQVTPAEAYLKFIEEANAESAVFYATPAQPATIPPGPDMPLKGGCGSCGGGQPK